MASTVATEIDIDKILTGMKQANREMVAAHESESVVVLGPTRAGKSTLVCMMSGRFTMCKNKLGGEKYFSANTGRSDLVISSKAQACTTFPARVESTNGDIYWDTPGFGDNKGVEQEVLNAYYIKRLMDNHRSVKTVFVIAYHQIQGAAKEFINGLAIALKMFESVANFKSYLTLVVTGVASDTVREDLRIMLQKKIIDSPDLHHDHIKEVKEYCSHVIKGRVQLVVMHQPLFESGQAGEQIEMKHDEYSDFIATMTSALKASAKISNLPKTNVVVSPSAKELLSDSCGKQIKDLARSFQSFIDQVMNYERSTRLGSLVANEQSIVDALRRLHEFDLFCWLSTFKDKQNRLSILTSASQWVDPFQFPKDVLEPAKATCTRISDEICMIVFFYSILQEDSLTLSDKLFREIKGDMEKLHGFYLQYHTKLATLASATLKTVLVDSIERMFKQFLDKTMSNTAAFVMDMKCELLKTSASGDIPLLVRKLRSTDVLGADCLGKEEHTRLQQELSSVVRIVEAFRDTSEVRIDKDFLAMCNKLLGEYRDRSLSLNDVVEGKNNGNSLDRRVHCYQLSSEAMERLQHENDTLKAQYSALQQRIADDSHLASVDHLKNENGNLLSALNEEAKTSERLDTDNILLRLTNSELEAQISNQLRQHTSELQAQKRAVRAAEADNKQLKEKIADLTSQKPRRCGWCCCFARARKPSFEAGAIL